MEPIVIIDDDIDDQDVIRQTLQELKVQNPVQFFTSSVEAFEYLSREDVIPFLILSDINMPVMNGFQLRDKIHADNDLRCKCIPYIFLTTGGESKAVWEAYSKNAQGFFIKPHTMDKWYSLLANTINYWQDSKKPR